MTKNVGSIDKIIRIVAGLALIVWGVMTHNWLGAIGLVLLVTGLMNSCPIFSIAGINSLGKK